MPLSLKEVREIYNDWSLESDVSDDLQDWHDESLNPSNADEENLLNFAETAVEEFTIDKGTFWLDWAITYLWHGEKSERKTYLIEKIVTNTIKYQDSGASRYTAARVLGDITSYPNSILKHVIQAENTHTESDYDKLRNNHFRAAAFGGYIIAGTDFQTGIEAEEAILSSGQPPTVEKAEEIIAKWRKEHAKSLPPSP